MAERRKVKVIVKEASINYRNEQVGLGADQRAAANSATNAAATGSTAGQGSAGIEDGLKAKRAIEHGPRGL
jgi:hypothetical protein